MKLQLAHAAPRVEPPPAAGTLARADWLAASALFASNLLIFGWGATRLGFYYDDGGWMTRLPAAGLRGLWTLTRDYVPGRNLHVLLQYAIYQVAGDPATHLPELHLIQSAIDGVVAAAFFLLLRGLCICAPAALMAAGLFSFWPIHGETHFWLPATPQNQLTTLFVLGCCWTTLEMVHGGRRLRLWLLDGAAFILALFTYDQVVIVLAALVAGRAVLAIARRWSDRWLFASLHIPYAAALLFYAWVKLRIAPGRAPSLTPDAWRLLGENMLATVASTLSRPWYVYVAPLYARATLTDWLLAALAAAALSVLALRLLRRAIPQRPSAAVLFLALCFYIAAYLPIWLWHISPRHHYLPSLGLFAGGAVCVAWLLERLGARSVQGLLLLVLGGAACAFAAADRGESRIWEASFTAKKELFAEIQPALRGKKVLALEGFPLSLATAYLILPHDAEFGPRLFYGRSWPMPRDFAGDVSSAPAPAGIFLDTLAGLYSTSDFRYYPTPDFLVVRFTGRQNGRFLFEINPPRPLPYQIVSSTVTPAPGAFAVHHFAARPEAAGTTILLDLSAELSADTYLTATLDFFYRGEFHPWGRVEPARGVNLQPVLLAESSPEAASTPRSARWVTTLRLDAFPSTSRIRADFFAAGPNRSPQLLGRAEAPVEP